MNRLFDKIPEELFAPLSRKYKTIYAFALVSLYHMLKLYKTDIKRVDYANLLKSQGSELMALFLGDGADPYERDSCGQPDGDGGSHHSRRNRDGSL